jgi:hypothetical protein
MRELLCRQLLSSPPLVPLLQDLLLLLSLSLSPPLLVVTLL